MSDPLKLGSSRYAVDWRSAPVPRGVERWEAGKSETRNPKSEGSPKAEIRKGHSEVWSLLASLAWLVRWSRLGLAKWAQMGWPFRASGFGLPSVFGFRISGLCHYASARSDGGETTRTGVRVLAISLLAVALLPLRMQAALSATAFDTANRLYEEGKLSEAISAYEKLAQTGEVCAALDFNLGNAYFKSGQIGRAIAAYREAQQITPRDPDLRANLQFARNQTPAPTLAPGRWQRWLTRLTLNEWTLLAAGAVWLWLLLLAILQWRPALRPALRSYVFSLAALAALLCACSVAALRLSRFTRNAIVVTREATARYGPLAESPAAFTLHDGAELQVLDQKDEWLQVTAGPGRIGWLRRDQTLLLPAQ